MTITNNSNTAKRADVLVAEANPEYSRAALSKLFTMGKITNAKGFIIKAGDKIQPNNYLHTDLSPIKAVADVIDLPIIYEDENVIVVDKPAGVISHARGKYWDEPSVASFIRNKVKFNDTTSERAGIVHRLDRATSGVMICAKNSQALKYLQKQFGNRKVIKQYVAVISGKIDPPQAVIDLPIARNPNKPQTMMVTEHGKQSVTEYRIIKAGDKYTLIQLLPKTGRMHQLRVHLKYLNKPIVGDSLYNGEPADRLFLHASSLEIQLPSTGKMTKFQSSLPEIFNTIISL